VAGAVSAEGRGALCRVQEGAAEGDVPLEDAAGGRRAYAERPRLEQHAVGLEESAGEAALHVSVAARSQLGSQEAVGSATEPLDDGAVVLHVFSEARVLLGCVPVRRNADMRRCGWRSVARSGCGLQLLRRFGGRGRHLIRAPRGRVTEHRCTRLLRSRTGADCWHAACCLLRSAALVKRKHANPTGQRPAGESGCATGESGCATGCGWMAKWDLVVANVDPGHQGVEAVAHILRKFAPRQAAVRQLGRTC